MYRVRKRRRLKAFGVLFLIGVVIVLLIIYLSNPETDGSPTGTDSTASASNPGGTNASTSPSPGIVPSVPSAGSNAKPEPNPEPKPTPPEPTPSDSGAATPSTVAPPPKPAEEPAAPPAISTLLTQTDQLVREGKLAEAREWLNRRHASLVATNPADAGAAKLRAAMTKINQTLVFSPQIIKGDPYVEEKVVQSGDTLSALSSGTQVPWQLVERINNVRSNALQIGQKVKFIRGPFHAVVYKGQYRMDVYLGNPAQAGATYVRSFDVGLGKEDGTPAGYFIVARGKAVGSSWRNPRNPSEFYEAGDPRNPIGKYWIPIRGITDDSAKLKGYGLHGTIEPESIGRSMSLGCVRMHNEDIELMFQMLFEEASTVTIVD